MGSLKDPKTWIPIPNITSKDCSQKICTIYCRQWCKYVILPSPPPPSKSADPISPVLIVLITLIGIVFLLISYYCILARYNSSRNNESGSDHIVGFDQEITGGGGQGTEDGSGHVPWIVVGKGLDEGLIKSITVCKYRKEEGIVGCTDCSVCLGEFEEEESVKVLPKCSHAFHVYCIDTWLRSHLNCPLCRANVCCDAKSV